MIRINLIPDVRQAKQRDQHRRRLAVSVGVLVCGAVLAVLVIMEVLIQAQKLQISIYSHQINTRQSQIEAINGLPTALAAQQTLNTLPGLYDQRAYYTHLFNVLSTLQPGTLTLGTVSNATGALQISGTASSYTSVALFAKALMVGTSATKQYVSGQGPFSAVTIGTLSSAASGQVAFTMTATINPEVLTNGR